MSDLTLRERLQKRLEELKTNRATWEPAWRDIAEHMVPYRTQWDPSSPNRGERKDTKILNSSPLLSLRTLVAGLMAGITSPAREWFKLTTEDPDLAEVQEVKEYLDQVRRRINLTFASSTFYRSLAGATYPDLSSVATHAMFVDEGPLGQAIFRPLPIGEYYLDVDDEGKVDTLFRVRQWRARQIVQRFGLETASQAVKDAYRRGNYNTTFLVGHAVMPNEDYRQGSLRKAERKWKSCWWELADPRQHSVLLESGYDDFPVLAPRWSTTSVYDAYGRGPGWEVRGDCRMLQHHERTLLKLLDKTADPPMRATRNIKRASLLPGDVTHVPVGGQGVYEPAMTVSPQALAEIEKHVLRAQDRIDRGMYANLWLMLVNDDRNQRATATEVEYKRTEGMLQLGPLLESLNEELLEPAVFRVYNILNRNDLLPLPPAALQGSEVQIKFVSIMHQMQQATGLAGIRTLIDEVQRIAQTHPEVIDKVDADALVDELGRITGVRPDSVLTAAQVGRVRAERAQKEQMREDGEAAIAATEGMKNLSSVDPQNLQDLVGNLSPAAAAQGGGLPPLGSPGGLGG